MPEMGVTPFIAIRRDLYLPVPVSACPRHARCWQRCFLIIEDEDTAQNIWARKRIKINADIIEIDRQKEEFKVVCDLFAEAGPTMGLIRDFSDFHLLRLLPSDGVMVLGFAKAYRLSGPDLVVTEHLRSS